MVAGMELVLKQVETEQEIAAVAQLASDIWHEYFIQIITKEQIDYMLDKFQSERVLAELIHSEGYEYYLMQERGENVGYLGVKQTEEGKLFLSKFYIRKEHRGQGYASQAMTFLVHLCKARRLSAIWLTVNRHNASTIAVYEKKGFRTVRTQVADIGKGYVMDDYIMEKEIAWE
jgi:diamine N-acetyltransferase